MSDMVEVVQIATASGASFWVLAEDFEWPTGGEHIRIRNILMDRAEFERIPATSASFAFFSRRH